LESDEDVESGKDERAHKNMKLKLTEIKHESIDIVSLMDLIL
jgi:hypothetical protein